MMSKSKRFLWCVALVAVAALLVISTNVQASLMVDLRVTNASGSAVRVDDKHVNLVDTSTGTITAAIYAMPAMNLTTRSYTGTNTAGDQVQLVTGNIKSTRDVLDTLHINATDNTVDPLFQTFTWKAGSLRDVLALDTDIDVGGNPIDSAVTGNQYWAASANVFNPTVVNTGILVGTVTWATGNFVADGATNSINFIARTGLGKVAYKEGNATGSASGNTSQIGPGFPIMVTAPPAPEPSTLLLLGMGVLGAVVFWRKRG